MTASSCTSASASPRDGQRSRRADAPGFGDEGGAHVHFAFSAEPGSLDGLAARLRERGVPLRGPEEHPGGDRSLYVEDPEGNVVEVWDFFERGDGARARDGRPGERT